MRVLFILEPVTFSGAPGFLSAHFIWADMFRNWARATGVEFALAANPTVCRLWQEKVAAENTAETGATKVFPIEPFRVLSAHGYSRARYAKSLYTGEGGDDISRQIAQIRAEFQPDMAVMTSQSLHIRKGLSTPSAPPGTIQTKNSWWGALAERAVNTLGKLRRSRRDRPASHQCESHPTLPIVSIEQAPLPRLGHAVRTMLDPGGHQVGSILETHAAQIRSLPLSPEQLAQASRLLRGLQRYASRARPEAQVAQEALRRLGGDGEKIALLTTQPTDWVTYEGAHQQIEMENLLYCWADQLPDGWIGVPTYHLGQRLSPDMENELARSHPRLRFLPPAYSQGMTEALLPAADGLVTISSTTAMTSLLFGKSTIVTGRSPFNAWCASQPGQIGTTPRLPEDQAARLLAFLTNRVIECNSDLNADPKHLSAFVENVLMRPDAKPKRADAEWLFDMAGWSAKHALRLFAAEAAQDYEEAGKATP